MRTVSAYGAAIAPSHIRAALFGLVEDPKTICAVMGQAQLASVHNLYLFTAIQTVAASLEAIEEVKRLAHEYQPITIMGIPIVVDELAPSDQIHFFPLKGGMPISQIVHLSVPCGFEPSIAISAAAETPT